MFSAKIDLPSNHDFILVRGACVLYTDSSRTVTAHQLTFKAGLITSPVIPVGACKDTTPLTEEITVANDISIGEGIDSDINYGVPDGTRFIGFHIAASDKLNYSDHSTCYGIECL